MILFVDGISRGVHCPNVGYWVQDYESAFELLTQLVVDEWTLLQATLIDESSRTSIPVEAFDGRPIQIHILELQNQWTQLLLARPAHVSSSGDSQLKAWFLEVDAYYEGLLRHLEKIIFLMETRKFKTVLADDTELSRRFSRQRHFMLESNRRMYQQTKVSQQRNRQRLQELERK